MEIIPLGPIEVRVLGCLVEKEVTTPDYYPLTLNALTHACNQKSNRDPVMSLEETDVVRALDRLRHLGLAMQAAEGSRVPRYAHNLEARLRLEPEEMALFCELLLRGPQTVGELRGRADRMRPFTDLAEVESLLTDLIERDPPLVVRLPRQPGRKENRFMHLLSGEPQVDESQTIPQPEAATTQVRAENERIEALERDLAALREEFERFKSQFE